jgi:hypothetical protein
VVYKSIKRIKIGNPGPNDINFAHPSPAAADTKINPGMNIRKIIKKRGAVMKNVCILPSLTLSSHKAIKKNKRAKGINAENT